MPRHLRTARRLDLLLVTLVCFVMAGCVTGLRREHKPDTKRVAYLGIDAATPALERAVATRLDPGYEQVPADEYRETARKLEAESMTDLDVARVARALDVDVIIHGRYVRKKGRRGHVEVLMRTAATGAVVAEYVVPVRRGAMTRRGQRKLDNQLRAELEALLGPPVQAPAAKVVASAEEPAGEAASPAKGTSGPVAEKKTTAAPGKQEPRVSENPAAGDAVAHSQPTPPAPVLIQDRNGQVIDDEQPPGL
jgi:hypothetical protein